MKRLNDNEEGVQTMKVEQIWRYPVKSMGGEKVTRAVLSSLGIEGDRVVHVEDARGHVITARTHHRLLGHHATLNASGEPVVGGLLWSDPKEIGRASCRERV